MFERLMAFLRRESREDSNEFDYTKQCWGHALQGLDGFSTKRKFYITGHCSSVGLIFQPIPKAGDSLTIKFTNGKIGILRIIKIQWLGNPKDMFSATVKFDGLKPEVV